MSEQKAEYKVDQSIMDDLKEANELMKRYPSVTIEPPVTVISRRNGRFVQEDKPAFVKISTDFKKEMAGIDEISLKVWLFIALSVNRNTGKAFPGLRTIATGTGFAVNTVRSAIERLESKYNLLTVERDTARYNIYEPLAFVSANHAPISGVSPHDTPIETVSVESETVSPNAQTVSARVILNQSNQINNISKKENLKKEITSKGGLDWQVLAGVPSEEIAALDKQFAATKERTDEYERVMNYPALSWGSKDLEPLSKFLAKQTLEDIRRFAEWSKNPYNGLSPAKARQHPKLVIDLWLQSTPKETVSVGHLL